jgi:hypothetical protein
VNVPDVFRRIIAALNQAGMGYMLSGSFASTHYGVPRSTQDIDLVIEATPAELRAFVEALSSKEYYADLESALEAHKRQFILNVIDLPTGWKIDLIIRKSRVFSQEEFRRRQRVCLHDVPLFVASAEDVVISKLEWAKLAESRCQIEDAAAILRVQWDLFDHCYLESGSRVRSQKGVGRGTAGGRDCGVKSELWEWRAGKSQASIWDCEGYDDICHDVCPHAWAQVDRVLRITRRPALPRFRAWFPVR